MENLIFGLSVSNYGIHCKRILNLRVEVASKDSLQAQFLTITNLCILQPFIDALFLCPSLLFLSLSAFLFILSSLYIYCKTIFGHLTFLLHNFCIHIRIQMLKVCVILSILVILFMLPAFSVCTLLSTYIAI